MTPWDTPAGPILVTFGPPLVVEGILLYRFVYSRDDKMFFFKMFLADLNISE